MSFATAFEVGRLYLPLKTIADQFTLAQKDLFIRLPGLRGYWPMSIVNSAGVAIDHSGASSDLLRTGSPLFDYDGNAYVQLGVATDFLYTTAPTLGITGTEAWIDSGLRGLTIGGWFWVDSTPAASSGLISKDAPATERGYVLYWTPANNPSFYVSVDGTAGALISYSARPLNTWTFIVGRFTPGAEVAIFVNADKATNTTSIPASINVSTQNFEVGRDFNSDGSIIQGRARDVFVCATALSDQTITDLYRASMPA